VITFGPSVATDLPVNAAVPPDTGEAQGNACDGADLFDAFLDQMIADESVSLESAAEGDEDSDPNAPAGTASLPSIDPAELVNSLVVGGIMPAIAPVTPTMLWSMTLAPATSTAAVSDLTAIDDQSMFADLSATDAFQATGLPSFDEIAAQLAEAPEAPMPAMTLAETPATPKDVASAELAAMIESAAPKTAAAATETNPAALPKAGQSDPATRRNKNERSEPRLDATAVGPAPAAIVERAYAGNDRDASSSFDRPRESAPVTPRLESIGQPTTASSFTVPVDARSILSAPAPAMTLAAGAPVTMEQVIETQVPPQIVHSIRMQALDGGGEAIVRLNPDYLGEVVVAVKVEQGAVTAALQAETPAVRQWVERNENILRQALAEQGLQLDRLTVTEKAAETEPEHESGQQQQREDAPKQQSRRRRPQAQDATFEVTV
jgi:flagellar hook-length control protein FliK